MEIPGGHNHKKRVAIYEFFGTSVLVWAVLISGGSAFAVPFVFFGLIMACDNVSGSHFNPAVTTGVYFTTKNFKGNFSFYLVILLAEFAGGLFGLFLSWIVLLPNPIANGFDAVPAMWIPTLCPNGIGDRGNPYACDTDKSRERATFFLQMMSTFVFVFVVMMVKGKFSSPTNDGTLGAISVSAALFAQINVCGNLGGACFNPAVALAQLTWGISQTDGAVRDSQIHYAWIYLLAPFIGGAFAGITGIFHEQSCELMAVEASKDEQKTLLHNYDVSHNTAYNEGVGDI